jgi:hypothetical protein
VRLRSLTWPAIAAAGALLPLAAVLGSGRTLVWRDSGRLFGPLRHLVVEALRDGRLPLWNPHEGLGVPIFAQLMHGALHPVSLLAAALAPRSGMDLLVVAHVLLAALGATALAREIGAPPPAAAAGGLAYGLSGYVLGMSGILQYLAAAGTAPWTVAALRAAGRGARLSGPAVALLVAASALAGDPQWTLVATALGLALALEAGGPRGLWRALLGVAVGAALSGVQLLPTWAHLGEARRQAGLSGIERQMWALSPWRIPELVAPGFFGGFPGRDADAPVFARLGGPSEYQAPFVQSVFVGAITLALALAGARASRAARILSGAALLLLWIALGTHLGADQLLAGVPVWGAFRYAEKLTGPLALCLALLAALGAARLVERPPPWNWPAAAGGALAAFAAALAIWPGTADPGVGALVRARLASGLVHAVAGLWLLALLVGLAARLPPVRRALPALTAGLVLVQGLAAAPFALHAGARGAIEERPLQALRALGGLPRIAVAAQAAVKKVEVDFDEAEWLEAVQSRMGEASFNVSGRIDQVATYTGLEPRRHAAVAGVLRREFGPAHWAAWRRFSLSHVVVNEGAAFEPEQAMLARLATQGGLPVLEDPWGFTVWQVPHRPWAFFAERAVSVGSEEEARRAMVELMGAPDGREVVLEGPIPASLSTGRVLAAERGPESLRIEAEADGDGLLVVNDAFWPGWEATVDGRPVAILPADGLVRAVPWPRGRHVLAMRYAPPEVRAGWLVSAVGGAGLLALLLSSRRSRRGARDAGDQRGSTAAAPGLDA